MSIARTGERWSSKRDGALSQLVVCWVVLAFSLAGTAQAVTSDIIYFDDPSGYGFVDPDGKGLPIDGSIDEWLLSGDQEFSPSPGEDGQFLLIIDRPEPSVERCGELGDICTGTSHPVEATWFVRLNEFHPLVQGNSGPMDVDLFLVDSSREPDYLNNTVGIYYESAVVDNIETEFETVMYSGSSRDYYFLSLALEDMLPGEEGIREIKFRYQVNGTVPTDSTEYVVPYILSAAFTPIPEPGTACMLGLGLFGLALKGRRKNQ